MVEGCEHRTYRVADSCSCPNSQKANSQLVLSRGRRGAVRRMAEAPRPTAPVALGTLRAGTLPLPPTSVDERRAWP